MTPKIEERIDGFYFSWPESKIIIEISRVNTHRDGRVTGEILIKTTADNYSPILQPPTQMNFSADRTRKELTNNLTKKYPDFPWDTITDELAYYIQDLARQGEPVHELWTHEEFEKPSYLLDPILVKGLPTIIFGEKGVAKSTLSLVLYICLTLPWHDNPLELSAPQRSIKTLILDWETERNIVQYYANKLQVGMELPTFPIYYRRCGFPLADDIEQIQSHISKLGAEVIIIDSLGAAAGGDLKSPEVALKFFSALRKLKVTSLIIAQTSKSEDGKKRTVFGSTYFQYYSRSIFELCKAETISDSEVDIALFHREANLSALSQPRGYRLHHNETGITVESISVDINDFRKKINAQSLILDALKQGLLTVDEIAAISGVDANSVKPILTKLKKRDRVVNPERGKWGLYAQSIF